MSSEVELAFRLALRRLPWVTATMAAGPVGILLSIKCSLGLGTPASLALLVTSLAASLFSLVLLRFEADCVMAEQRKRGKP